MAGAPFPTGLTSAGIMALLLSGSPASEHHSQSGFPDDAPCWLAVESPRATLCGSPHGLTRGCEARPRPWLLFREVAARGPRRARSPARVCGRTRPPEDRQPGPWQRHVLALPAEFPGEMTSVEFAPLGTAPMAALAFKLPGEVAWQQAAGRGEASSIRRVCPGVGARGRNPGGLGGRQRPMGDRQRDRGANGGRTGGPRKRLPAMPQSAHRRTGRRGVRRTAGRRQPAPGARGRGF